VQDAHEHDPDRLAEVEQAVHALVRQHLSRFPQVRPDRDDVRTGHQRIGVGRDQRVDVDVDDASLGR
jgi:hypothetical protein